MSDKLIQSQQRLHDSLFELYIDGGLELFLAGTRGLKRDLIIDLETSALTPDRGEIIHYRAVNRWDEDDLFDEWAKPSRPLSSEAEMIVGTTNEKLAHCRSTDVVLDEFFAFVAAPLAANSPDRVNIEIPNAIPTKTSAAPSISPTKIVAASTPSP